VPYFRGGFGITPIAGSAISAFYPATCALVVLLGSHGGTRPAPDFADTWAPGLNLTSPDSWSAPLLQALSASHALLLQDYGCIDMRPDAQRPDVPWSHQRIRAMALMRLESTKVHQAVERQAACAHSESSQHKHSGV